MARRVLPVLCAAVAGLLAWFLFFDDDTRAPEAVPQRQETSGVDALGANNPSAAGAQDSVTRRDQEDFEQALRDRPPVAAVEGVVLDAETLQPVGGVEVLAMSQPPSVERFFTRIRSAFAGQGIAMQSALPEAPVFARTTTGPDGFFHLDTPEVGRVFLDAKGPYQFVRTPSRIRLAAGETLSGVELLASVGGQIVGTVTGPDGGPVEGAVVSVRPGLNAFLGQLTQRNYRWLETTTDVDGQYALTGVPAGDGYTLVAAGETIALTQEPGLTVRKRETLGVDLIAREGALIAGTVVDVEGRPVPNAVVAMVYLDLNRALFSSDGRSEPARTDAEGRFALPHVASGRVGISAFADGLAPSDIVEVQAVDGGRYDDLELFCGVGEKLIGRVVDTDGQPIQGAAIEVRPTERPKDPDVVKLLLSARLLRTVSDVDGLFEVDGLTGSRTTVQATKEDYVTAVRFGVESGSTEPVEITLEKAVTVRGRVIDPSGEPVSRFSVDVRSREIDPETGEEVPRNRRRGPPWAQSGQLRLEEGQGFGNANSPVFGGSRWKEFLDEDGRFEISGIPPGKLRVRVRNEERLSDQQEVILAAGEESESLEFTLDLGAVVRGRVVDAIDGQPVAGAQVTAYEERERESSNRLFQFRFDPEDFDFLGLSQSTRRSAVTESDGTFEVRGLAEGAYRLTARHPDRAKASERSIEVVSATPTEDVLLELETGGSIEGAVTGAGGLPLADALIVALSIQAGGFKSDSTDQDGRYLIDGLTPGSYIVFKSRLGDDAAGFAFELLGNLRFKTVTVRKNKTTTLDIEDASDSSVRLYGKVWDGDVPVSRALVTALGSDSDGIFGLGVRANSTDQEGNYEIVGLEPGEYFLQVNRFLGRPVQVQLAVDIPEGAREMRFDLRLPQSAVRGRVVDSNGQPVPRIQVSAGLDDGAGSDAAGLLGLIVKNGLAQTRTRDDGTFELPSLAAGSYRITASGRAFGGGRRGNAEFGDVALEGLIVDGTASIEGIQLVIPRAGVILGQVRDGNGQPVSGAEIVATRTDKETLQDDSEQGLFDLFGVQRAPVRTDENGNFEIRGVTPGTYSVLADADGVATGVEDDVFVVEEGIARANLSVVVGARLRVRVTNVQGDQIRPGDITVLDGKGNPIASRVSVTSIFRALVGSRDDEVDSSGWYDLGKVPPDTYTVIIREPGQPDFQITRTLVDGEEYEWDIDMQRELEAAGRDR